MLEPFKVQEKGQEVLHTSRKAGKQSLPSEPTCSLLLGQEPGLPFCVPLFTRYTRLDNIHRSRGPPELLLREPTTGLLVSRLSILGKVLRTLRNRNVTLYRKECLSEEKKKKNSN